IAMDEVRKKLFSISLSGKAAHWYKLLKNRDSLDWEDIVPLFYSKFYPPSEIHKDRNRIYNFWPHDGESIAQAWGRLKSLMLKCPIHELPGNVIIDNFYARLSFQDKTLLDTSCSGSFTRNKEEFKRDLLDWIQENTEGWENDKDRESGIIFDYKCIEAFMDTDKFRNMSATYGLDSQVVANLYKAFASHYELPKKNFDKYHEPYKDKIDSSVNKCVVIETVDHVIPEAYIEKTPFPAKMKEYSVISSAVNKSEKKPIEPEEQIKVEPAVAIVKDLVTENVEDDDGGSQKGEKRGPEVGPPHRPARPKAGAPPYVEGPTPLASFSSRMPSSENLSHEGTSRDRLCGAENTREKRALRRAGIRRGNSSRGNHAIAIVIELDIISIIIIIIISTIYTAITTAAPRHRCNDLVADACKGYNHNESFIETTCQHLLLLVGIDILTYRRYYDTPPILVGHQDYFLAPLPGSEALLRSSLQFLFGKSTTTATVVDEAPGIAMDEVRKKLFSISLSGKAAHWYKLLKNRDSLDWEDIVPLFYSKFYPPSEIHKDRNRIYNFWPHDGESIAQAWGRLKSLMLKCPIHELPGNVIIDNFYARLSFQDKTLLDTSCSGSFTRNKEEFKRDLLDRIQENTEGWENDKDRESGIIFDYKCIEAFMDTDKFRNMSATYGLDSQVVANLYKAFASHYELPKKNFDKYHEPYKDKIDSSVNKCVVIETVDHVIPEAYIEKTPFPAKMKEYSVISSVVNKSEKKPIEPEEQIKVEPVVAIVKDLVTENVEDGHIIFCEDASNIVSHPNKPKQVSVPMLSVRIGDHCYYGLCDIGASVSAIPYELYTEIMHEIDSCELEDIDVVIQLANRETISPIGIVRDVEVLCGKIKYPADFLVLGSAASDYCPIIFGRPFLNTCGAIIDCKKEKILTKFAGESYEFNFSKFTKTPYKADLPSNDFKMEQCASIVLVPNNPLQQHLENSESEVFRKERDELEEIFLRQPILKHDLPVEDLGTTPPPKEDPVFDLKPLPDNLKYAHIDDKKIYPVIISSKLSEIEEERLLEILKKHRGAIGYTLDDLKGISPSICQHAINMEDDAKPVVEHQRRLIPKMKEVVRNEVLKLLEAGIIYPIADSRWVSPVHCVPKKGGMTVVPNDNDELIPQRVVVGYRMCIDFRKVNKVTKKDHYPLPFIDQMLERLENIAYDPVPVNDSFPNEQLAVIKGVLPPALDLDSFPCVEEAIRVADEFCDQYRALRREVEILQEENQRLRRMLEYYSIPSTRPSPPHSDNNESLQVLVQNCKTEKLKLKEILKKREKNPSPSSPKE
ncbi:hypothetical protein QYE76_024291, partial [Lolium multiflorum]